MISKALSPVKLSDLLDPSRIRDRLIAAGMTPGEADNKGKLFAKAAKKLIDSGRSPDDSAIAVFVPGRIEVLGKHTDYCGGRSLICTVEKGLCFVALPREDSAVCFHALDLKQSKQFQVEPELLPVLGHWSNYPMTIARRIARNFPGARTGADIALAGDLPAASGLSSSSAMMIGTFLVLSALNHLDRRTEYLANIKTDEDLAGYLGCCENGQSFRALAGDRGVGTFGGSQDHTAILCCRPGKLSVYSFCPVAREHDVDLPEGWTFVVAASGVVAEKTGDALQRYNAVSLRARKLVELWNAGRGTNCTRLREVIESSTAGAAVLLELLTKFAALDAQMGLTDRLEQFVVESDELIPAALRAIEKNDAVKLRRIVDQSQANAERLLQNQIPETISLQRRLLSAGAIAASAFGAGFGGSVWGFVEKVHIEKICQTLAAWQISHFVSPPSCPVTWITGNSVKAV